MNHIWIEDKIFCTGCAACANICPKQCISFAEDAEGFCYPKIEESLCVECGRCTAVCPVSKEKPEDRSTNGVKVYACINRDEKVLKESSSGGVFSLLAEAIIEKDGVVFGAAFDENWNVRHMAAQTKEDCLKFRGSKYVQSEIGDSFFQAKAFLDQGRPVLFSGAPCQIAGLNSFLGKKYPNLTTCDFICTGIPNPKAFRAYRDYFAQRFQEPLTGISFRDKKYGWDAFSMVFRGKFKEYRKIRFFDPYINAFYSHILLRPACYHCQFKKCNSESDIKLADYWYVNRVHPELPWRNGVSLVLVEGAKGQALFDKIASKMKVVESKLENVYQTNASFATVVKEPPARKEFLKVVCHTDLARNIVRALKSLPKPPLKDRIITRLRFLKHQMLAGK